METTSSKLTPFQKSLRERLEKELKSLNKQLVDETIGGEKEYYITGKIGSTDLKIWIYKDSAEFTDLDQIDCRYEAVDYDSAESLIENYVVDLAERLKN